MRFALILLLVAFSTASTPVPASEIALFTVDVNLRGAGVDAVEVVLECDLDTPLELGFTVPVDSSRRYTVPVPQDREVSCLLMAKPIPGQQLTYLGDGGSEFDTESQGCRFTGVRPGHSNFCQIQVENRETSLTVFKRWIGTSEREAAVKVFLACDQGGSHPPLAIKPGRPAAWSIEVDDEDGFLCSVSEEQSEDWIEDVSDCRNLLILPGAEEECTVVNTKVVKMIEMLNRYGLVVMILVFMVVGGFAARKFIP